MPRPLLALVVLLVPALLAAAPIGRVTALEGDVAVWRDGKPLDAAFLAEGLALETDDRLVTGVLGQLEVALDKGTGVGARLRLGKGTQVVLDVTSARQEQVARIELLAGSVKATVPPLTGRSRLRLHTSLATLTTQGATFQVLSDTAGDWAVATSTGRVDCRLDDTSSYSEPGTVIVLSERPREARTVSVNASTLEAWGVSWKSSMDAELPKRGLEALRFRAALYQQRYGEFQRAWDRWLREGQTTWNLWRTQDAAGKVSPAAPLGVELRVLGNLAVNLRQSGLDLERDAARLTELRTLVQARTVADGQLIAQGYTVKEFYQQFDRDAAVLPARFDLVRQVHKAYLERSRGDFPAPGPIPEVTRESPFFN